MSVSPAATFELIVDNVAPGIVLGNSLVTVDEGQLATNSGTYNDPGDDSITLETSIGMIVDNLDGTWSWSFGAINGPADSQMVTITATDSDGGASMATFELVVNNLDPNIVSTVIPSGGESELLTFMATAMDPGIADILTYEWDFGDGTPTVTGATVAHAFIDNGDFSVTLTVTDGDGGIVTQMYTAVINNISPTINFYGIPSTGNASEPLGFTASATDPGMLDTLTYTWDFGDGSPLRNGATVGHVYVVPGMYTVTLVVADNGGGQAMVSQPIEILALPGDFNEDGAFDCDDINALVAEIAAHTDDPAYDLTGDRAGQSRRSGPVAVAGW